MVEDVARRVVALLRELTTPDERREALRIACEALAAHDGGTGMARVRHSLPHAPRRLPPLGPGFFRPRIRLDLGREPIRT